MRGAVISRILPFAKREDRTRVQSTYATGMRWVFRENDRRTTMVDLYSHRTSESLTLEISYLPESGPWLMFFSMAETTPPVRTLPFDEW